MIDRIQSLLRRNAQQNHLIQMTDAELSAWLDSQAQVSTFGDVQGVVALSPRGELGFVIDPHAPPRLVRQMYRFIAALSVPCYAHILLSNREVLGAAKRMGFVVIGGTDRSVLMRRN